MTTNQAHLRPSCQRKRRRKPRRHQRLRRQPPFSTAGQPTRPNPQTRPRFRSRSPTAPATLSQSRPLREDRFDGAAHTEVLFAIGAGGQVSAVDNTTDCPQRSQRCPSSTPSRRASRRSPRATRPRLFSPTSGRSRCKSEGGGHRRDPADRVPAHHQRDLRRHRTARQSDRHVDDPTRSSPHVGEVHAIGKALPARPPNRLPRARQHVLQRWRSSFVAICTRSSRQEHGHGTVRPPAAHLRGDHRREPGSSSSPTRSSARTRRRWRREPLEQHPTPSKTNRVYGMDPDIVSREGPRIIDALRLLKLALYG